MVLIFPCFAMSQTVETTLVSEPDGTKTSSAENTDIDQQKSRLSDKYTRGRFLIYDCFDKNWVCTDKNEVNNCKEKRRYEILEKNEKLPCAVFKKFDSENECHKQQTWVTNNNLNVIFCINPKYNSEE